ncbi:MAG: hypothetical protein AB1726_09875 [Planctomycetota bacterium]
MAPCAALPALVVRPALVGAASDDLVRDPTDLPPSEPRDAEATTVFPLARPGIARDRRRRLPRRS